MLNDYDSIAEGFINDPIEVYQRVKIISGAITLGINKGKSNNTDWKLSKKVGNVQKSLLHPRSPRRSYQNYHSSRSPK